MTTKAPAPFAALCDAPTREGGRCGRVAWRVYQDDKGDERGMCWIADHSWQVMDRYPPAEDAVAKVPA